ncbi:DUF2607 family protein [Vibrio algarum]|uniref:DUF2607 family protein n=1 Tax=Vibrio algarum TaxID=3020714 RepID=A0ABT4YL69_9VIBR|nr:DUF2607 family protein [Vibrio sp. KJ40-1]MDB1122291.1 DUF2607 family protein [Vibrio sp. KJ40-1]
MNTQLTGYCRLTSTRLTSIVLVLVLWTGFAFIEHQLDFDETHHENHHCQLFSSSSHAITSTFITLPIIVQKYLNTTIYTVITTIKALPIKKARAPPKPQLTLS